jgi:NADH-quinone oxidoreductase subunit L
VQTLLEQAQPAGTIDASIGVLMDNLKYPSEHDSHFDQFHVPTEIVATLTALPGFLLAVALYGLRILNPSEIRAQFRPVYEILLHKWYFDELYNVLFVQPVLFAGRRVAQFDRKVIDGFIDRLAVWMRMVARLDDLIDRYLVDGLVNGAARWTYGIGLWFRGAETGKLRQYVMFIVIATVAVFLLITFYLNSTLAGV